MSRLSSALINNCGYWGQIRSCCSEKDWKTIRAAREPLLDSLTWRGCPAIVASLFLGRQLAVNQHSQTMTGLFRALAGGSSAGPPTIQVDEGRDSWALRSNGRGL